MGAESELLIVIESEVRLHFGHSEELTRSNQIFPPGGGGGGGGSRR